MKIHTNMLCGNKQHQSLFNKSYLITTFVNWNGSPNNTSYTNIQDMAMYYGLTMPTANHRLFEMHLMNMNWLVQGINGMFGWPPQIGCNFAGFQKAWVCDTWAAEPKANKLCQWTKTSTSHICTTEVLQSAVINYTHPNTFNGYVKRYITGESWE